MNALDATAALCRLVADPTRLRLLALLTREELTVAELTRATRLPQSRISTHLGRLREAGLVRARRQGVAAYYSPQLSAEAAALWGSLRASTSDPILDEDARRAEAAVRARQQEGTWAEAVAGQMARHYSPGRTWEALTRGLLGLLDLGDVIDVASGDGAVAEMLAPTARSITCIDHSEAVVQSGRRRLAHLADTVRFVRGDMHELPFDAASFDHGLVMSALAYSTRPEQVLAELARVLRPGASLVGSTLRRHDHAAAVHAYDHQSHGHEPEALAGLLERAGFDVSLCGLTSRERRAPHFEIVTFHARRRPEDPS